MRKCVGHSGTLKAIQCLVSSFPDAGRTRVCGRQCKMGRDLQRKSKSMKVCSALLPFWFIFSETAVGRILRFYACVALRAGMLVFDTFAANYSASSQCPDNALVPDLEGPHCLRVSCNLVSGQTWDSPAKLTALCFEVETIYYQVWDHQTHFTNKKQEQSAEPPRRRSVFDTRRVQLHHEGRGCFAHRTTQPRELRSSALFN